MSSAPNHTQARGPPPASISTTLISYTSDYILKTLHPHDEALSSTTKNSDAQGLPPIAVAETQGKFLYLMAKMKGAKKVLEIGTLGGYSAIWFAKAVAPLGGTVTSLEISPHHAKVAEENIANAGFSSAISVVVGPALETLEKMLKTHDKAIDAFDVIFIDANKDAMPEYFEQALKLSKAGTAIVLDNVVRKGRVLTVEQGGDGSEEAKGVRAALEMVGKLQDEGKCEGTVLQLVSEKSWDGMAIILVN